MIILQGNTINFNYIKTTNSEEKIININNFLKKVKPNILFYSSVFNKNKDKNVLLNLYKNISPQFKIDSYEKIFLLTLRYKKLTSRKDYEWKIPIYTPINLIGEIISNPYIIKSQLNPKEIKNKQKPL